MRCSVSKCKAPFLQVSGHHIKSRGAWGPDIEENLIALCISCHTKIHQYGINKFTNLNPEILSILFAKGWRQEIVGYGNNQIVKWFNDKILTSDL